MSGALPPPQSRAYDEVLPVKSAKAQENIKGNVTRLNPSSSCKLAQELFFSQFRFGLYKIR
jgi:hypothetical protein